MKGFLAQIINSPDIKVDETQKPGVHRTANPDYIVSDSPSPSVFKYNFGSIPVHGLHPILQAKLTVSTPGDRYEQEADSIAEQLMRMPEGELLHRMTSISRIVPSLQTKTKNQTDVAEISPGLGEKISASRGDGTGLDLNTLSFMSGRIGFDFRNVKIHTDNEAVQMNRAMDAKAFTAGSDIFFNSGEYQQGSLEGRKLLAHELIHVIQQSVSSKGIQKKDPNPKGAAATEEQKMSVLIKKIKTYGISAVEDSDATFTSVELNLVDKALAILPAADKVAIKGAKIVRVRNLGPKTAGRYSNTQSFDGANATDEQKIELSDKAFDFMSAAESIRLITHEAGHAVATKTHRIAMSAEIKAGLKSNKLVDEANTAVAEFNTANDQSNAAVEDYNAAVGVYNLAIEGTDKKAISVAKAAVTAKKSVMNRLKAARKAKETVFNTKKVASEAQKTILSAKEAATKTKIANIDILKTDAAAKLTTMKSAYTAFKSSIKIVKPESSDYSFSLTAVQDAINTFYDKNVTVDVDERTAENAKSVVDISIKDRNDKRDTLNKLDPKNNVTSATAALETAQDSCFKAAVLVAFYKRMNLSVKRFYDFVIKHGISANLTPYAAENWPYKPEEFYAEAYSFFVAKPKSLETHSKLLYDWFKAGSYK